MRKNLGYKDLTAQEAFDMEEVLWSEIGFSNVRADLKALLSEAIWDYKVGLWKYDGPTFSKVHQSFWEVPAFLHDWRNSVGYVGREYDDEMFCIMIYLNYPMEHIIQRWKLTRFTFANVWRHKLKGTYKNTKPSLIFKNI